MKVIDYPLYLIPLFPLLGFLVNGLLGKRFSKGIVALVGCGAPLLSFIIALFGFRHLCGSGPDALSSSLWDWISAGGLQVSFGLWLDPLSAIMCLIVSGVGFLIHLYSVGYMQDDPSFRRYFAYLNLFLFSMFLLVLGDSLPLLFVGWEGVGLCSYLLIGFWFEDGAKADAGKKAFLVNRVGDFGFLLGMFVLVTAPTVGTLSIPELRDGFANGSMSLEAGLMTAATLCLFIGAMGKSAQFPLYVWLPDAMAGPTPVSALIHAATMVTAGVYMIGRLNFLFVESTVTLTVVALVGAFTALYAAILGLAARDIKKVLAFSTVSQLGYMFVAMGAAAFTAGVFHLMTHAFFKALLFLGSGAVIHALHGEQDMFKMGGLFKHIKVTAVTFIVGSIALAGIPGFAGFFSKDEILAHTFAHGAEHPVYYVVWGMGMVAAALTAFYITRCVYLTFFGEYRGDKHALEHLHKPGFAMGIPLVLLAVLSVVGGYVGLPPVTHLPHLLNDWLSPVWSSKTPHIEIAHSTEWILIGLSSLVAIGGAVAGWVLYSRKTEAINARIDDDAPTSKLHGVIYRGYYMNEILHAIFVWPVMKGAELLWFGIDRLIIDGVLVNGSGMMARFVGNALRRIQTGVVNYYLLWFLIGAILVLEATTHLIGGYVHQIFGTGGTP